MRSIKVAVVVALIVAQICVFSGASESAVQIVSLKNNSFELNLEELRTVLDRDGIRERSVVVVSIAGPVRQGKSFLLNFFLRYLNAQVIMHMHEWCHFASTKFIFHVFSCRQYSTKRIISTIGSARTKPTIWMGSSSRWAGSQPLLAL